MFGLLSIGAGLLGFGSKALGQRREADRQIDLIDRQEKELDAQQKAEQGAYRQSLRRNRSAMGSGDFARGLFASRLFTGF